MPFDPNAKDVVVGVIGTGTMGRGIIQVSAQGGMQVMAFDEKPGAAAAAKDYIAKMLGAQAEKGRIDQAEVSATLGRISIASSLEDLVRCNIIVEAIIERLDIKQVLYARLDEICGPDTIIASNTSSLPITAIAAKCARHPERIGGMHFFNPVPLMKLVEVIPGIRTAGWVSDAMMVIGRRMTREPVLCVDSPGFIVNHAGRGMGESQRILIENIARPHEIDRILTGAPGFKLGPFALGDMVGIDVGHAVTESFFDQFYAEPAYAPSPLTALRYQGGLYGQKTGRGWYDYKDGKRDEPEAEPTSSSRPARVWVYPSASHADLQAPLIEIFRKSGVPVETGDKDPGGDTLIVITPIGYDLTTAVSELKLDGRRTVAVDVLFGMKGPRELMVSPETAPEMREAARGLLGSDGHSVIVINDSPGFVSQRIVAMIVNVGCQIAQRAIATPADIDKAVKLGLGYPYGPLEWGEQIGPGRIAFILQRLHTFYQEPRYRPSPWLKRRVALGLPLSAPEGRS